MRSLFRTVLIIGVLLTLPFATDSKAESTSEQIKALKQQIEQMQKQNQQQIEELQQKIQDLEVKKEAEKEKIIEEIKAEQKDAWYNKIEVSYKKPGDGFTIRTKDGNFSLNMRLRAQFQFSVNDTTDEDTATSFRVRRLRFYWIGNAFRPWFEYYIQVSADSSFSGQQQNSDLQLRDAYFNAAYEKKAVPRVGQFKVPFNREELNSSSELQLVERSIVNEQFSLARDVGTALYGLFGNYVTYGIGIFNGDGRNEASLDSNMLYVGRVMLTPCCGELKYANSSFPIGGDYKIEPNFGENKVLIAIGAAVAGMEGLNTTTKSPDNTELINRFGEIGIAEGDFEQFTADINVKYEGFSLEGEYDARWIQPGQAADPAVPPVTTSTVFDQGFRVQGGVFLLPKLVEVAGRFAYIDFDTEVPGPDKDWEITPGLNFYMSRSHKWKIQLSYSYIKNEFTDSSDINENIFRAQLQAYF
ncbi:MAG: porin [Thermodesulfobacteriota bacterium]